MARYDQCDDTCTTDCGHCKGAGPPTTLPVSAAALEVSRAIMRLVVATEDWQREYGEREDYWSTGYPASRDMTEEAMAWARYADALVKP